MGQPSWVLTVITQISLCFALYLVLNLGEPQQSTYTRRTNGHDIYFISVSGGFRPLQQQALLLKQMERVVKTYDAMFVVMIGELGHDDPLLQNGTRHFPALKVPWYIMEDQNRKDAGCFLKKIGLPLGKSSAIISVNTSVLQDHPSSKAINDLIGCLTRMLEAADSLWRIVIGLHPLTACEEGKEHEEMKQVYEHLQEIFVKYQVNAYLSRDGCVSHAQRGSVAYISHPGPTEKRPSSMSSNRSQNFHGCSRKKTDDGFLVHRVSLLEFETYFVTFNGNVNQKYTLHQKGFEAL